MIKSLDAKITVQPPDGEHVGGIKVDPTISVFEGHEISHRVKDRLLAENQRIQDVLIHIEPADRE
jgi:divalent metal cation (Fe/Co/Zn/Cd) transporter